MYFQDAEEVDSLRSYQSCAFEHNVSGIISHGICRSWKRVVVTLNTKFNFISGIAYSIVDPICLRVVKMRKVFLMIK